MLISVVHDHVPGLTLCPNYTLCCHLGFSGVIYSLSMVEDDDSCKCTDGHNINNQFLICCVGFGPRPFTSHFWIWRSKSFSQVIPIPIPISFLSAKIKSFEKYNTMFLIIFIYSTFIQQPWGKWLCYKVFIYIRLKKISKERVHVVSAPTEAAGCHKRAEDSSPLAAKWDIPPAKAHALLLLPLSAGGFITVILYVIFSYKNVTL